MLVKLEPVEARGGPITAYQVIVIDASLHRSFQPTKFINYNAAEEAGLPYWVAAQLRPEQLERTFLVGDNKLYGGFWNHKLPSGKKWKVGLAVVSKLNGKTKRSYSGDQNVAADRTLLIGEQQGSELSENSEGSPSSVVVGLTVATVLAAVLLLGAVAVFVYLRHSLGTRCVSVSIRQYLIVSCIIHHNDEQHQVQKARRHPGIDCSASNSTNRS